MPNRRNNRFQHQGLQPLSRLIRLSISSRRPLWIPLGSGEGVCIDGLSSVFHEIGEACEHLCRYGVDMRGIRFLNDHRDVAADIQPRPLPELRWIAAYHEFDGQMPAHLRRDDIISLKEFPPLSRLPHKEEFAAIADMLVDRPTSPAFAARLLKISEQAVCHFYTTAWHAGWIEHVNRIEFHAEMYAKVHEQDQGFAANLAALLKTDLKQLRRSEAYLFVNRHLRDILNTDVMDILTADLLSAFRSAETHKR